MRSVSCAFVALLVVGIVVPDVTSQEVESAAAVDGHSIRTRIVPPVSPGPSLLGVRDSPPPTTLGKDFPQPVDPQVTEEIREEPRLDVPMAAYNPPPPPPDVATLWPDDAGLYRLRMCESTDNYAVNTGNGFYGGYQFVISTWNGVAARHRPELVGVRPDRAAPADQDDMVRHLWAESGRYPWPVCGRRV